MTVLYKSNDIFKPREMKLYISYQWEVDAAVPGDTFSDSVVRQKKLDFSLNVYLPSSSFFLKG